MILVDKDLTRVEVAVTHKQALPRFQEEPQENMVHIFKNFEVERNVDQYKVASHPWMLKFHNHTLCKDSETDFPTVTSSFIPIETILCGNAPTEDLIGTTILFINL